MRFEAFEPLLRVSWATTRSGDYLVGVDPVRVRHEQMRGLLLTPGFMLYATGRTGISTNLDVFNESRRGRNDRGPVPGDWAWSLKVQAFVAF